MYIKLAKNLLPPQKRQRSEQIKRRSSQLPSLTHALKTKRRHLLHYTFGPWAAVIGPATGKRSDSQVPLGPLRGQPWPSAPSLLPANMLASASPGLSARMRRAENQAGNGPASCSPPGQESGWCETGRLCLPAPSRLTLGPSALAPFSSESVPGRSTKDRDTKLTSKGSMNVLFFARLAACFWPGKQ